MIVGVNEFTVDEEPEIAGLRARRVAVERQIERLADAAGARDGARSQRRWRGCAPSATSGDNVVPAVLECVKAYATTGEICDVWRDVFGEYVPGVVRSDVA